MNLKQWHIDWLAARDLPQALEIESESFGQFAWSEKDFRGALQCKNVIGIAARPHADATYICGFAIYALLPSRIEILNLAVGWQWRRNGFGAALLQRIKDRLSVTRRRKIKATARDSNIESHLFLASGIYGGRGYS